MHFFLGPRAVDDSVYPDIEEYYADLAAIYREEIDDLAAEGCTFFQFDETALPCNCDDGARAGVEARGEILRPREQPPTRRVPRQASHVRHVPSARSHRTPNATPAPAPAAPAALAAPQVQRATVTVGQHLITCVKGWPRRLFTHAYIRGT